LRFIVTSVATAGLQALTRYAPASSLSDLGGGFFQLVE